MPNAINWRSVMSESELAEVRRGTQFTNRSWPVCVERKGYMEYREFIARKTRELKPMGFKCGELCDSAFDWQRVVVEWAVKRGRAALFEDCGLGKTIQQLMWADQVAMHTGGRVVIHCPVGVRNQTAQEAERFGISGVRVVDCDSDISSAISLVNYEKLHKIDTSQFAGVVLDESSILKSYTGKTKRQLCEAYSKTPYRLCCTATAAPNDHMEIGNHADFLGVMPSNEMLSRWFINDTMKAGGYRLKGHAESDFWKWVSSWAICLEKPSDIGYLDDGYELPEKIEVDHVVDYEQEAPAGYLFATGGTVNATTIHKEKRQSSNHRARVVAEIVNSEPDESWIIWCDTNYEADVLAAEIPDAVEVRGNDSSSKKEELLNGFSEGKFKRLITKPTVAGFGMNWQHCSRAVFIGLSFSYEQYYQAIRRIYRFGQKREVEIHCVSTPTEAKAREAILRKSGQHDAMKLGMAKAMASFTRDSLSGELKRESYEPTQKMEIPKWLHA